MLMHAIAHGAGGGEGGAGGGGYGHRKSVCTDSGRKIPCRTEELNPGTLHADPTPIQLGYIPYSVSVASMCV